MSVTLNRSELEPHLVKLIAGLRLDQVTEAVGLILDYIDASKATTDGEVRLWDSQWMNIVNHDNRYLEWSKEDAIAHAVKMTEEAIARNVADRKLPPFRIPSNSVLSEKEGAP
ncbi:hypothetical protein FHW84_002521 [Dyella sp. SG562]|uniref:hypothetical protein n=1 Tax=Dyella sp. SG562 TaxID=2587017 RepID=UPI00141EE9B9|nr:hypothetical protein [Dyella sp. SG562]NII73948.1 hypothetical protein [Dyella sp. SG562]